MKKPAHIPSVTFLLFLSFFTFKGCADQPDKKPNILFILIDDMGWKDIGCSGSTYYETPNIDRLAGEGLQFLNAYSAAIVCTPSRGAIYSGKFPARTKLTTPFIGPAGPDNRLFERSKYQGVQHENLEAMHRHVLPKGEVIMAEALADGGYMTGFFGKWHVGECKGYYPEDRGFQVAKGYRMTAAPTSRSGHWMKTFHKYGTNLEGADKDAYVADVLTDECIDFITENRDKPWLAVLSHYLVHLPVQPKPEKLEYYKKKPTTDQTNPGYASMIGSVDESVGRMLESLEALGLDENTLVIFTSDNGGLTPNTTSNYPLMGGKSFPFEAGTKVPFIVRWPKMIEAGTTTERINGTDIYPTMLAAAGLPLRPNQHMDGVNLLPVMTDHAILKNRPIIVHNPHYTHAVGPFSSIIYNNWKLIHFYNDEKGAYLLYNLNVDPQEQNDLADKEMERRDQMAFQLDSLLADMDAELPIKNPDFDPSKKPATFHLNFTVDKAMQERKIFEERQEIER